MIKIKRAVSGINGWNTVFELENGLFAMSTVCANEPVQLSMSITTFLRHGYFIDAEQLDSKTVAQSRAVLEHCLSDEKKLHNCMILGNKKAIRGLLGLCEEENI